MPMSDIPIRASGELLDRIADATCWLVAEIEAAVAGDA